jgi:hypothetical protein
MMFLFGANRVRFLKKQLSLGVLVMLLIHQKNLLSDRIQISFGRNQLKL